MADGFKRATSFNKGILHCGNRDMGKYGGKRVWLFIGAVILLPAHPASFAHKFLFQGVPGCNSIADLSLKIVLRTHKFAVGTH